MVFKTRVCWLVVAASATQAFQSPTKNEIPLRRTFTKVKIDYQESTMRLMRWP